MVTIDYDALLNASAQSHDAAAQLIEHNPKLLFTGGILGYQAIAETLFTAWDKWVTGRDAVAKTWTGIGDTFQAIIDTYQDLDCSIADGVRSGDDSGERPAQLPETGGPGLGPQPGNPDEAHPIFMGPGTQNRGPYNPLHGAIVGPITAASTKVGTVEWGTFQASIRASGKAGRPYFDAEYSSMTVAGPAIRSEKAKIGDAPVLSLMAMSNLDLNKEEAFIGRHAMPNASNEVPYIPIKVLPGEVKTWLSQTTPDVLRNPNTEGLTVDQQGQVYCVDRVDHLQPLVSKTPVKVSDLSALSVAALNPGTSDQVNALTPGEAPQSSIDSAGTLTVSRAGHRFADWKGAEFPELASEDQSRVADAASSMGVDRVSKVGVNPSGGLTITSENGITDDLVSRRAYRVEDLPLDRPEAAVSFEQILEVFGDPTTSEPVSNNQAFVEGLESSDPSAAQPNANEAAPTLVTGEPAHTPSEISVDALEAREKLFHLSERNSEATSAATPHLQTDVKSLLASYAGEPEPAAAGASGSSAEAMSALRSAAGSTVNETAAPQGDSNLDVRELLRGVGHGQDM